MIEVVLVTSSHNLVLDCLGNREDITLRVIDCAEEHSNIDFRIKDTICKNKPDLIITYRCPYILPQVIFSLPRLGAFNIHPSLLPKYPGLNPWEAIFRNHEQEGGVTLHRITEHIDAGPIIYQATFPIVESDTV